MPKITVDANAIARLCGLEEWPAGIKFNTELRCIAARAVTDFMASKNEPFDALSNAETWIERAYSYGKQAGIREESDRWKAKIKGMFGL